jgi:galactokinase
MADLETVKAQISPEAYKRCKHVITENARVRSMQTALEAGDAHTAGQLMITAHASQRDDFQCSVDEIDFLVDTASKLPGCYGARMTGGGFGGCTVNLVRTAAVESFTAELTAAYSEKWGIQAETYVCEPVDGALRRNLVERIGA